MTAVIIWLSAASGSVVTGRSLGGERLRWLAPPPAERSNPWTQRPIALVAMRRRYKSLTQQEDDLQDSFLWIRSELSSVEGKQRGSQMYSTPKAAGQLWPYDKLYVMMLLE